MTVDAGTSVDWRAEYRALYDAVQAEKDYERARPDTNLSSVPAELDALERARKLLGITE